jgi:hypothetical protein
MAIHQDRKAFGLAGQRHLDQGVVFERCERWGHFNSVFLIGEDTADPQLCLIWNADLLPTRVGQIKLPKWALQNTEITDAANKSNRP